MTTEDQTTYDIENEIKLKRLNPEFLSEMLVKNLEVINSKFDTSFSRTFAYRKRFKDWEKEISKPNKQMDVINKKVARTVKLISEIQKRIETRKDYTKQDKELQEIMTYIETTKVDFSSWSTDGMEELEHLMLERQKLLARNKIGSTALSGLLNGDLMEMFFTSVVFIISFVLSFFVGDFLEQNIKELGPIISKLIPALLFFVTLDKLVKKLEIWLSWNRVKYLNKKYCETILNINQQTIILTELEKNIVKKSPQA
jgi:hypothetical protein